MKPWSINAVNLPEHGDNPVHTVAGGLAAGFGGAVVAGTTIAAYMTRPVADAWGIDWLTSGGYDVAFRGPVLADDPLTIVPDNDNEDDQRIVAKVGDRDCAWLEPTMDPAPFDAPVGRRLEPTVFELADRWTCYAARAGEDLGLYTAERVVHPVVWITLANRVFVEQMINGAWVHTRSRVAHRATAAPGDVVVIEAFEIDRFETRIGERAVVQMEMSVDGVPVVQVEHEALVRLF
jgi:hypothetical protein